MAEIAQPGRFMVADAPHAPVIYFENAPVFGHVTGNVTVTLSTQLVVLDADKNPAAQEVVVAYLRCNDIAARCLRDAIDKALLGMTPTEGTAN